MIEKWLAVLTVSLAGSVFPALADIVSFQSPSGHIHCMIETDEPQQVRCDVMNAQGGFSRPSDCDLDWGHAFLLTQEDGALPLCAGDTTFDPAARVLPYDEAINKGGMSCTMQRSGVRCSNSQGRGFELSRSRQRLF